MLTVHASRLEHQVEERAIEDLPHRFDRPIASYRRHACLPVLVAATLRADAPDPQTRSAEMADPIRLDGSRFAGMTDLIVVTGPPGAGKSTVARWSRVGSSAA